VSERVGRISRVKRERKERDLGNSLTGFIGKNERERKPKLLELWKESIRKGGSTPHGTI